MINPIPSCRSFSSVDLDDEVAHFLTKSTQTSLVVVGVVQLQVSNPNLCLHGIFRLLLLNQLFLPPLNGAGVQIITTPAG